MEEIKKSNKVINTTESVKKPATDSQLQAESFKKMKAISKSKSRKFKCSSVYASLYPDGFLSTYQGVIVELVFDNREIELPEIIIDYVEEKLQAKADREAEKLNRFKTKKQEKIGEFDAE